MSDNKPVSCIRCGAIPEKDDRFCTHCGAPLINRCTKKKSPLHKGCLKVNRPDASFCASCGAPTTFNEYGLL